LKQDKGISNTKGRPRHLEAEDIISLRRHIRESATKTKGVKRAAEVEHAIDNIATENYQIFHYGSENKTSNVSESTKKRVKICSNIKNGYAQVGTKARLEASALAFAASCEVIMKKTCCHMIWNSDATQFTFGNVVTKRKACYLGGDDDPNDATSFSTSKRPASLKVEPQNERAALQDTILNFILIFPLLAVEDLEFIFWLTGTI